MGHAFGIPALTKSRFGKNQSYEVLTPDQRYTKMPQVLHAWVEDLILNLGPTINPISLFPHNLLLNMWKELYQ